MNTPNEPLTPRQALTQLREKYLFQPRNETVENGKSLDLLDAIDDGLSELFQVRSHVAELKQANEALTLLKRVVEVLMKDGAIKPEKLADRQLLEYCLNNCPE